VLADDQAQVLEEVRAILEPEFEVVATAGDGQALVAAVIAHRPDLVVADISMPTLSGLEAVRRISQLPEPPRVVFLTIHQSRAIVDAALAVGACGFVVKSSADVDLVAALRASLGGGSFVSPSIQR